MLNYINAELYKVLHRKYTYIFLALTLLFEAALVFAFVFNVAEGNTITVYSALRVFTMMLTVGIYLTLLVGDIVFSEQYKTGTLKNEISFGIPRTRIILGKLIVQCITAIVFCAIIAGFYIGLSWIFLPHVDAATTKEMFEMVGWCLLSALPLWLGAQALTNMSYFVFKNSTVAAMIVVGIFIGLGSILQLMAFLTNQELFTTLRSVLLNTPFSDALFTVGDKAFVIKCWLIGAGWFAGSTILGLVSFSKREIN